jgi:L-glyceraldehyde 3-phosphate reductase
LFIADEKRYEKMIYRRLGKSGLKLPVLSLGLWLNFGGINDYDLCKKVILESFNHGITHFDLANNYGPPPGSAELLFGRVLKEALMPYRDQLIISTKAGYKMWEGPYGDFGSRKYLMSSIDQSLERLGIPYVDIFYHHRFDPHTDLKETMTALRDIVLQGKALYVGLSNYNSEQLIRAYELLDSMHVPYVITQPSYSMLNRWTEKDHLLDTQEKLGAGTICFSVLSQGKLSNKYINDIPTDSRAKKEYITFFTEKDIDDDLRVKLIKLNQIAQNRNQTISQMALAWALRDERMTSALISVSKISQLYENLETLKNLEFSKEELKEIEHILG